MKLLDKAIADIDASSRDNTTSTSIRFGTWVGYGACSQIVKDLHEEMEDEFESRICKNCIWFNGTYCIEEELIYKMDEMVAHDTFGCNRFSRK
jgi:hypothetical protein